MIAESLSENIREPEKAKYLWAPFPAKAPANGKARYCAAVNAKSPHAAYNGLQPYLVQVQISNGQIVSSVVGAIAGGSDLRIVRNLCAKHGLNPDDAALTAFLHAQENLAAVEETGGGYRHRHAQ